MSSAPPTLAFGPAAVAAATSCKYTHRELNIYSGPIETYTAHDEAYVCWNGTKAWQQDYRYCYVSAYPLGFGGVRFLRGDQQQHLGHYAPKRILDLDLCLADMETLWVDVLYR